MELKVYCDGLPRVISGVTEATTCHDVVLALAQAMGRTGHYTLVERWRDTERVISPDEAPVDVLQQWGEYAGDVTFILKHSQGSGRASSADSRRTSKSSLQSFTPLALSQSRSSSTSSLRKSLTFSGAHAHSSLRGRNSQRPVNVNSQTIREGSSTESLTTTDSSSFGRRLHGSTSSHSSSSASSHRIAPGNGSLDRTRRRTTTTTAQRQPLHNGHVQPDRDKPSPPSTLTLREKPVPRTPQHNKPSLTTSTPNNKPSLTTSTPKDKPTLPKEYNNNSDHKPNANLHVGPEILITSGVTEPTAAQQHEDERKRQELLKVVNLQMEKMKRQEDEMKVIEQEMSACEEVTVRHKASCERNDTELSMLQRQEDALDSELQDLELVSWVDKLSLEQEKERRLRQEITNVNGKVRDAEGRINEHNTQIQKLTTQCERENQLAQEASKKRSEEITSLRHQLAAPVSHKGALDDTQKDIRQIEAQISERQEQIRRLEAELKDANLERLSRSTPPGPDPSGGTGLSVHRPGSARRLESPQRLRETAISARHPQGLWV